MHDAFKHLTIDDKPEMNVNPQLPNWVIWPNSANYMLTFQQLLLTKSIKITTYFSYYINNLFSKNNYCMYVCSMYYKKILKDYYHQFLYRNNSKKNISIRIKEWFRLFL